jgi:cytochrome c
MTSTDPREEARALTTPALRSILAAGLLAAGAMVPATAATPMPPVMASAGCTACHASDKKMVGPAYDAVAAKYKGQADAAALLAKKVREGGKGVWGPIPMPPHPAAKISDADLAAAIAWVLQH